MTSLEPTAPSSFQSPAMAGFASSEASLELASGWRRLTRAATFVALLTSPALVAFFMRQDRWPLWKAVLVAIVIVIAFRGLVDLLFRRVIPWPSLFGLESQQHREEDVLGRRRARGTNLLGPIRLTAALLPRLLAQPRSAVLNVTSALAFLPKAQVPTYCATKAALHSYTQSLRFQLRNTAVQVIEIMPPGVQTGLRDERVNEPDAMPLDEYIAETMALLTEEPEATEIVVDATKPLRFAERDGVYEQRYTDFNTSRSP